MGQLLTDSNRTPAVPPPPTPYQYRDAVMLDGPSALWILNDASGAPLVDYAGHVANGSYTGPGFTYQQPSLARDGSDTSILADGTSGAMAAIPANVGVAEGTNGFTIECLVKANSLPLGSLMMVFHSTGTPSLYITPVGGVGGHLRVDFYDAGSNNHVLFSAGAISQSQVHHVAVVVDYVNEAVKFYIDGAVDSNTAIPGLTAYTTQWPTVLFGNGGGSTLDGYQQYVAFYNKPLTDAQLAAHAALV